MNVDSYNRLELIGLKIFILIAIPAILFIWTVPIDIIYMSIIFIINIEIYKIVDKCAQYYEQDPQNELLQKYISLKYIIWRINFRVYLNKYVFSLDQKSFLSDLRKRSFIKNRI